MSSAARVALCFAVVGLATTAHAGSVEVLLNMCKAKTGPDAAMCTVMLYTAGELMAFNGTELANLPKSDEEGRRWLITTGLCSYSETVVPSGPAMVQAFENWAEKHPEYWGDDQGFGITRALSSTWPCRP